MSEMIGLTPKVIRERIRLMERELRMMESAARRNRWYSDEVTDKMAACGMALAETDRLASLEDDSRRVKRQT